MHSGGSPWRRLAAVENDGRIGWVSIDLEHGTVSLVDGPGSPQPTRGDIDQDAVLHDLMLSWRARGWVESLDVLLVTDPPASRLRGAISIPPRAPSRGDGSVGECVDALRLLVTATNERNRAVFAEHGVELRLQWRMYEAGAVSDALRAAMGSRPDCEHVHVRYSDDEKTLFGAFRARRPPEAALVVYASFAGGLRDPAIISAMFTAAGQLSAAIVDAASRSGVSAFGHYGFDDDDLRAEHEGHAMPLYSYSLATR